jgi:predicted DNA-binding protein (MmcQ/YjbR family)
MPSQPTFSKLDAYCLSKKGSFASYPFDETTRVYKVAGKMFALFSKSNDPLHMNLKCDPEDAAALRAEHPSINAGFHMNKKHWITLILDGSLSNDLVSELIDHSYDLVVKSLTKLDRKNLGI